MIRPVLWIVVGLAALSLALALLLPCPAEAAISTKPPPADPGCYTVADLEKEARESGGTIAGTATYDGMNSDVTVFVQGRREIIAFGFKDGCLIGMRPVDLREPVTPA